jgi:hypothetical protein
VERSHGVDQDRLIKELRLADRSTIEAANRFLETEYTPQCNRRFAVPATSSVDAHRRLTGLDLKAILSRQETRVVANDYTVQYEGQKWQIERQSTGGGLRRAKVTVQHRLDGSIKFHWRGRYLKTHRIATPPRTSVPRATSPAARRAAAASGLRPAASAARPQPWKPPADHPWRKRTVLLCRKEDISTLR